MNTVFLVLCTIILLVIFPIRITSVFEFDSQKTYFEFTLFLFTYVLVDSVFFLQDKSLYKKENRKQPDLVSLNKEKKSASRLKSALVIRNVKVKLAISNENNPYLQGGIISTAFYYIRSALLNTKIPFNYEVLPINYGTNKIAFVGKATFETNILKTFCSLLSV